MPVRCRARAPISTRLALWACQIICSFSCSLCLLKVWRLEPARELLRKWWPRYRSELGTEAAPACCAQNTLAWSLWSFAHILQQFVVVTVRCTWLAQRMVPKQKSRFCSIHQLRTQHARAVWGMLRVRQHCAMGARAMGETRSWQFCKWHPCISVHGAGMCRPSLLKTSKRQNLEDPPITS